MEQAQPSWQWDEATWRWHVQRVRAGRSLKPAAWPNGERVAVALSFDSDHETIGRLLERHGIKASFFIPAVSALLHPEEARGYVEAGHEIGITAGSMSAPCCSMRRTSGSGRCGSADTLERITGQRPVGIRTPSWEFSDATLSIIHEMGLTYDSSLMADDEPYELLADGEPTGVVEIPVEWIRDDAPYFSFDRYTAIRRYTTPRAALTIWRDEFDGAYADKGLFHLTMHPHITGHRSRIAVLEQLIEHISGHTGVWWATHAEIAECVAASLRRISGARDTRHRFARPPGDVSPGRGLCGAEASGGACAAEGVVERDRDGG